MRSADWERGWTMASTIVSATNGKTTTAGMIASALRAAGRSPVHNRAGSNMSWGVATALLDQSGTEGLFEVDEAWLPRMARELNPSLLVLGNLFRDQLDRYGELERLADDWSVMVEELAGPTGLVLNADDPLIADLGRDRGARAGAPRDLLRARGQRSGVARAPARVRRKALPPLRCSVRV